MKKLILLVMLISGVAKAQTFDFSCTVTSNVAIRGHGSVAVSYVDVGIVSVTATAEDGWIFYGWETNNSFSKNLNALTILDSQQDNYTAVFSEEFNDTANARVQSGSLGYYTLELDAILVDPFANWWNIGGRIQRIYPHGQWTNTDQVEVWGAHRIGDTYNYEIIPRDEYYSIPIVNTTDNRLLVANTYGIIGAHSFRGSKITSNGRRVSVHYIEGTMRVSGDFLILEFTRPPSAAFIARGTNWSFVLLD